MVHRFPEGIKRWTIWTPACAGVTNWSELKFHHIIPKTPFIGYSMARAYAKAMAMSKAFLALSALSLFASPVWAEKRRGEQDQALNATQNGAVRSLRSIENSIVPAMRSKGASYIGQEFDGDLNRYRLKFMRGKSVIWVDVDGRTGAIIGQAGG
jgi:hypothetical protein